MNHRRSLAITTPLAALFLASCGGGGGSHTNPGPARALMPFDQRKAILDQITSALGSISASDTAEAANDVASLLKTEGDFEEVGVAKDNSLVWGRFKDGVGLGACPGII